MNKKVLIAIIVAVVLIGGGVTAFLLTRNESDSTTTSSSTSEAEQADGEHASFDPAATTNVSFVAVLTSKSPTQTYTANMEHDGKGSSKFTGDSAGTPFEMYLINGEYITCNGGQCIKTGSGSVPLSEGTYSFSPQDIENFRAAAVNKGHAPCPAGECDLWQVTREGQTYDILVASDNKISKVSGVNGDTTFEIVFTYKDVTITPPANVQTLPGM